VLRVASRVLPLASCILHRASYVLRLTSCLLPPAPCPRVSLSPPPPPAVRPHHSTRSRTRWLDVFPTPSIRPPHRNPLRRSTHPPQGAALASFAIRKSRLHIGPQASCLHAPPPEAPGGPTRTTARFGNRAYIGPQASCLHAPPPKHQGTNSNNREIWESRLHIGPQASCLHAPPKHQGDQLRQSRDLEIVPTYRTAGILPACPPKHQGDRLGQPRDLEIVPTSDRRHLACMPPPKHQGDQLEQPRDLGISPTYRTAGILPACPPEAPGGPTRTIAPTNPPVPLSPCSLVPYSGSKNDRLKNIDVNAGWKPVHCSGGAMAKAPTPRSSTTTMPKAPAYAVPS